MLPDSRSLLEGLQQHRMRILAWRLVARGSTCTEQGPAGTQPLPGLGAAVRAEGLSSPRPPLPSPRASSCSSAQPHWQYVRLPYAKHLRSQLTAAINTHGALSRGEHYHTAELHIPNLGSEALCVLREGRLPLARLIWGTENKVRVTQPCSSVLVLAQVGT